MKLLYLILIIAAKSHGGSLQNLPGMPIDDAPITVLKPVYAPRIEPVKAIEPFKKPIHRTLRHMDALTPGSTPTNLTPLRADQIKKD